MELYILRHGETQWNKLQRLQGSTDIPLDEAGIRLAKETGEALKDVPFDLCYTSPLKRAVDTAAYVLNGRQIPVIKEDALKEINFGRWEGSDCSEGSTQIPEGAIDRFFDLSGDRTLRSPGGESLQMVLDRTHGFYQKLLDDPENENRRILISMHGASGRALMHSIIKSNDFWCGQVPPNCSVCIADIRNRKASDVRMDCIFTPETVKSKEKSCI